MLGALFPENLPVAVLGPGMVLSGLRSTTVVDGSIQSCSSPIGLIFMHLASRTSLIPIIGKCVIVARADAESPRVSASGPLGPARCSVAEIFLILLLFTSSVIVLDRSDYRRVLLLGVDIWSCSCDSNPACPPARLAPWLIPDRTAAYLAIAKCRMLRHPLTTPPPPISASATTIGITVS